MNLHPHTHPATPHTPNNPGCRTPRKCTFQLHGLPRETRTKPGSLSLGVAASGLSCNAWLSGSSWRTSTQHTVSYSPEIACCTSACQTFKPLSDSVMRRSCRFKTLATHGLHHEDHAPCLQIGSGEPCMPWPHGPKRCTLQPCAIASPCRPQRLLLFSLPQRLH